MAPMRHAVLIGNAVFSGDDAGAAPRLPTLQCPAADVGAFKELLESESRGGYSVTALIDRPHHEARRAVYQCLKNAGPEDQVIIYYSGHGKLDAGGNLYLAGSDTDPETLDPTAFAAADIQKYVTESQAAARIVILDCCFSGAVGRAFLRGASKGDIADQVGQAVRGLQGRGVYYLTASSDTQTAEEKEHDRYSLLTKHIIEGIRDGKADADDDGMVGFSELCRYVQDRVRLEGAQRPLTFTLQGYGDPVIALTGRPALSAKRDAIEQVIYELRQRKMLDGGDAARVLQDLHRQAGSTAGATSDAQMLVEALYEARANSALFLKTLHRLTYTSQEPRRDSEQPALADPIAPPARQHEDADRPREADVPAANRANRLHSRPAVWIALSVAAVLGAGLAFWAVQSGPPPAPPATAQYQAAPSKLLVNPGVQLIRPGKSLLNAPDKK